MNQTAIPHKTVYIAGALTDMSEDQRANLRKFYEDIADVCREFELEPYVPHVYGDPKLVAHLTPKDIDRIDRLALTQSYLVILYAGVASTGVGVELEMAHHSNKPVVLLFEDTKLEQRTISRLVRGNPAVKGEIAFKDFSAALKELRAWLAKFHEELAGEQLPHPLRATYRSAKSS
ncbi:MAG TPA: hypothetical protein VMR45_05720 [Patescibacteria group bacterium]|nr:hypothetical protein [Patescibacteria group bacterium]